MITRMFGFAVAMGVLFAAERSHAAVRPTVAVRTIISRVDDDSFLITRMKLAPL